VRIPRNFAARPDIDRQLMLEATWCEGCARADLGMSDPEEYEEDGHVFLAGRCARCGRTIVTELHERRCAT
jgi:hypothetical protein